MPMSNMPKEAQACQEHPFAALDQNIVMDAVETQGFRCDGCTFPLNSYENRVYQVGIEEDNPVIVKVYRPNRWSQEQILEEHEFCIELEEAGLPVISPMQCPNDKTLFEYQGFTFTIFPRRGGHAPDLTITENLRMLGRMLGRIHSVSVLKPFQHRLSLSAQRMGVDNVAFLSEHFIPEELLPAYNSITRDILAHILPAFENLDQEEFIRVHGDCHPGNLIWRDETLHFVDFDDTAMAPAVQDIWMLLSGDREEQAQQLHPILQGYTTFCYFNPAELRLIEPLRTLRIINYAAWLAKRWNDPAFPRHFPWFNTTRYWSEHILTLREQLAALQEPALPMPMF